MGNRLSFFIHVQSTTASFFHGEKNGNRNHQIFYGNVYFINLVKIWIPHLFLFLYSSPGNWSSTKSLAKVLKFRRLCTHSIPSTSQSLGYDCHIFSCFPRNLP